jgi:hypothetical protein
MPPVLDSKHRSEPAKQLAENNVQQTDLSQSKSI